MTAILAIVPEGSGVIGVHRQLASGITGYGLVTYNPKVEYAPWLLKNLHRPSTDIVHCTADYGYWACKRGERLVATFHNYVLDREMRSYSSPKQRLHYATDLRLFTKLALRRAACVTAVSAATANLVRSDLGYDDEIIVIPNGIDTQRFKPAQKQIRNKRRVLFCGNPSGRKGFPLLPAIARSIEGVAELVCALGGRDRPSMAPAPNMRLLEPVPPDSMPAVYQSAEVLVFPSIREGMSLALLEAMASGLPVVAWKTPSSVELLGNDEGGLLASNGDLDGLIDRLRWLLQHPQAAIAMGRRNRAKVVQQHSSQRMVSDYEKLFRNLT